MSVYDTYNSVFNSLRYKKAQLGNGVQVNYADSSDAYANVHKMVISFQHVPTGKSVFFKAFITAFNEQYSCRWAAEEVYGRADPLYLFNSTTRKVTLAFKIPAGTESEAYENLGKLSSIAQFLYPGYSDVHGAQTISQAPLVRIKVMNLLQTTAGDVGPRLPGAVKASTSRSTGAEDMYDQYVSSPASESGLLGVINSLTINHNIETEGVMEKAINTVMPKLIDVNLAFSPLHEHPMGWDAQRRFGAPQDATEGQGSNTFPYGVMLQDPADYFQTKDDYLATAGAFEAIVADQKKTDPRYLQALEDEARARYRGAFGKEGGRTKREARDSYSDDPYKQELAQAYEDKYR